MVNFDPNYLSTRKTEWVLKKIRTSMAKTHVSKNLFVQKVASRARAEGQNSNILTQFGIQTLPNIDE